MVAMINKQLSVYLSNYLVDAGMSKVFVKARVHGAILPALNHGAGDFKRGSSKKTVTTPEDDELERPQVLREAAWYKYEYGSHMSTKGRQNKKEYASPDMLYDIDGEHSLKTIHKHPGKGYSGTLSAATIDLQSKAKSKEDVVDDESSKESSDLSNMSTYKLIACLCKLSDISDSGKVPAPQSVKGRVLALLSSSDESDSSQEAANNG